MPCSLPTSVGRYLKLLQTEAVFYKLTLSQYCIFAANFTMLYRVIGLMSGSSGDGLDIAFTTLEESRGKWNFEITHADCIPYTEAWQQRLLQATQLSAYEFQLFHHEYGVYTGSLVNTFIEKYNLAYQVQLIGSHGHTIFHNPAKGISVQAGSGAAIAAITGINVISDLRSMDLALGGQGAPIVPVGEQLLFTEYDYYLNLGGIANVSVKKDNTWRAWDICAANRVLNTLAAMNNQPYDDKGAMATTGKTDTALLTQLNALSYYKLPAPKSLGNDFSDHTVLPLLQQTNISTSDLLHTYCRHIAQQIMYSLLPLRQNQESSTMLITGGGAFNDFLLQCIDQELKSIGIKIVLPGSTVIKFKEALIMALIAVLRWREEYTCYAASTGAKRNSIGGAVWIGQEA